MQPRETPTSPSSFLHQATKVNKVSVQSMVGLGPIYRTVVVFIVTSNCLR